MHDYAKSIIAAWNANGIFHAMSRYRTKPSRDYSESNVAITPSCNTISWEKISALCSARKAMCTMEE